MRIELENRREFSLPTPAATLARRLDQAKRSSRNVFAFSDRPFVGKVNKDGFRVHRVWPVPFHLIPGPVVTGEFAAISEGTAVRIVAKPRRNPWLLLNVGFLALIVALGVRTPVSILSAGLNMALASSAILLPGLISLRRSALLVERIIRAAPNHQ